MAKFKEENKTQPVAPPTNMPSEGPAPPLMQGPDQGNPYEQNPDYLESGMQTGVDGETNYVGNIGIDPNLLDYTNRTYENSPYANRDYSVKAGQAKAHGRTAQENEMSAYQLQQMLASDSPLMKRAAAQAMAGAGSRGLMNSSIAQGAAMGSMIDRAQPFALQDASSHGRAATETLAAKNQAALTNAQLNTQAGIAGMQAGAGRDSQLLASELGGRQDLLRHTLGMETREDQQAWQGDQSMLEREWRSSERKEGETFADFQARKAEDFQGSQNRLAEQFKWADTRQQAVERWAEGEFQMIMNRENNRESALSQIASSIFGNPELTAAEQQAAWQSAQKIMSGLHDGSTDPADFEGGGPTWSDPGYKLPPLTSSASGTATQPQITAQNKQLNHATGQVYKSTSSPNAAKVTEALPPII